MSRRAKFVFITWIGPSISALKKAKVSTDKAFVKNICNVCMVHCFFSYLSMQIEKEAVYLLRGIPLKLQPPNPFHCQYLPQNSTKGQLTAFWLMLFDSVCLYMGNMQYKLSRKTMPALLQFKKLFIFLESCSLFSNVSINCNKINIKNMWNQHVIC